MNIQQYELRLGIDGFWSLYYNGNEVFMIHDDKLPNTDDRLTVAVQMYEAEGD